MHYIVIISGPEDQVVAPGDLAYFHCHASGTSVKWHINGTIASPRSEYERMGFQFIDQQLSSGPGAEYNNTVAITANKLINNTQIECVVREYAVEITEEGTLIIAGKRFMCNLFNFQATDTLSRKVQQHGKEA